jgi:hypothetical protein
MAGTVNIVEESLIASFRTLYPKLESGSVTMTIEARLELIEQLLFTVSGLTSLEEEGRMFFQPPLSVLYKQIASERDELLMQIAINRTNAFITDVTSIREMHSNPESFNLAIKSLLVNL